MPRANEQGWVILSVLLIMLMVAVPLSFVQQEWLYLARQQAVTQDLIQNNLNRQSLDYVVTALEGEEQ